MHDQYFGRVSAAVLLSFCMGGLAGPADSTMMSDPHKQSCAMGIFQPAFDSITRPA